MINILLWGIGGRLGQSVIETIKKYDNVALVGGVDKFANSSNFNVPIFKCANEINVKADVIIDFSRPEAIYDMLPYAKENKLNVVLATTGHNDSDLEYIKAFSEDIAIFKSRNMSLGISLLTELAKLSAKFLGENFDIEIIEKHHNIKVDAPSGTALAIAEAIKNEFEDKKEFVFGRHSMNQRREPKEIGIHAIRGGTIIGKHDVMFIGNNESITISHEAESKIVFASGAIRACQYLINKEKGIYNMEMMLSEV